MTLYTSKVIAQWLCLTERRVRQLRDEGVIVEARPGLYELQPTVARYIKYLGGAGKESLNTERMKLTAEKRKAAEMDNDLRRGDLHSTFKSITFDNGTEFAAAEGLERSCVNKRLPRTKVYFCHPYSSWERGTNENTNGMIRRRFPKGTNFAAVTNAQITQAENWINNYPRKILGYKSSEIVFRECLRELGIAA